MVFLLPECAEIEDTMVVFSGWVGEETLLGYLLLNEGGWDLNNWVLGLLELDPKS